MIEEWARLPVEIDVASEYRYRDPAGGDGELLVGITQSGETADTLAAMRAARSAAGGCWRSPTRWAPRPRATPTACSHARRDGDRRRRDEDLHRQVAAIACSRCSSPQRARHARAERAAALAGEPRAARPGRGAIVGGRRRARAARWFADDFFLFLGRHAGLPVALEGALKLKEVSYIPTDAYAAGEMKHGPIALLAEGTPVVCVATAVRCARSCSRTSPRCAPGAPRCRRRRRTDAAGAAYADDVVRVPAASPCCSRSWPSCRCSSWPTTSPGAAGSTSTSRATSPRP